MHTDVPLSATWSQIKALLDNGYSLIPVHDKGKVKTPYAKWERYKDEIITPAELWTQMERFNTSAVAMICGRVSGNMEAIDLDVKWKPGIEAKLFKDIQAIYPNLWTKLRLHRTPSGGFHILYRIIDNHPTKNTKLAKRLTTPEDNTDSKMVAFIETRGEGGYVVMPPSLGYSIYKAEPIPLITWAERCALVALCEGYNEIIKVSSTPKVSKRDSEYYDENPFEHFNRSDAGRNVLLEFNWTPNGESSSFAWFMRPGSKSGERHASFIKDKCLFYFWTTNEIFESGRCYQPATILNILKFDGDWKQTYKELVQRGFGRIRSNVENRIIVKSKEPPPNLSPRAKEAWEIRDKRLQEAHPAGRFWVPDPEGGERIDIDREALYEVSGWLGFRLYRQEIVRLRDPGFIERVTERTYFDVVKEYIKEDDPVMWRAIVNTYEHFLQVAGSFTVTRLPLLDESQILCDTPICSYKFFRDCWIKITANTVEKFGYDELHGYVWLDKVFDREWTMGEGGRYVDFLNKSVEFKSLRKHVLSIIGYLAHEYKDETTAYIIVLTEQCFDPKHGGGSGKNLFCNLFKYITTVATRPGEQIKYDEKFFQTWNGERVFVISDAPRDFKFLFLKELTSGSAVLKKLWKDEEEVTVERLPKIIVNTNYSYEISDGGLKRRIIPLEFTDFFTRNSGVRAHYGAHFPLEWDAEDWAGYNKIMIEGIQEWLQRGMILESPKLTVGGWRKQFEQTYGYNTAEFIYENWNAWVEAGFVPNADFKKQMIDYFEAIGLHKMYQPSGHKINKAIEDYAGRMGVKCELDVQRKFNGFNVKGKVIGEEAPF